MIAVGMILAAGASRRFGPDNKLQAAFRGKPLVRYAADSLRETSVTELLAVISDSQVGALLPEFHHIPGQRMLSRNIASGARWAKAKGAGRLLVVLGDMPFVTATHCDQLIERCGEATASASGSKGMRSPPACFPSSMFDELIALTGERGAKGLIDAVPSRAIINRPEAELLDIDTPADIAALGNKRSVCNTSSDHSPG